MTKHKYNSVAWAGSDDVITFTPEEDEYEEYSVTSSCKSILN